MLGLDLHLFRNALRVVDLYIHKMYLFKRVDVLSSAASILLVLLSILLTGLIIGGAFTFPVLTPTVLAVLLLYCCRSLRRTRRLVCAVSRCIGCMACLTFSHITHDVMSANLHSFVIVHLSALTLYRCVWLSRGLSHLYVTGFHASCRHTSLAQAYRGEFHQGLSHRARCSWRSYEAW